MPEDAGVRDMREEARLRRQLLQHVRNVVLAFRRKGFLVARTTAKRHHDHLALLLDGFAAQQRAPAQQRRSERHTCNIAQKITPAAPKMTG